METQDWRAVDACFRADFDYSDRRLLGFGALSGSSMAPLLKALVDLAPDVRTRVEHVRLCERGVLNQTWQSGTHDGGAFERAFLAVWELDAQGRAVRGENFDLAQLDQDFARFEEIEAGARLSTMSPFENAASRAVEASVGSFVARGMRTNGHGIFS